MVGHGHAIPLEVAKTVVEIAEVAWSALEHRRESRHDGVRQEEEVSHLRSENLRLRGVLDENLQILQKIIRNHSLSDEEHECPPDLYARLEAVVDSSSFLTKLEALHQESTDIPNDLKVIEHVVDGDNGDTSQWAWVTKNMVPDKLEEVSGIDDENYVLVSEENVVDGIAEFIAKCIHENPKSKVLKPEELRRMVTRVLGGIKEKSTLKYLWDAGKVIYALSTWGICIAGLYRGRAVVKAAAIGVHAASKVILKAI